jgi:hypothetical protein
MIRTAVFAALALSAIAAPTLAFETHSAPAPKVSSDFTDARMLAGMMPATTSEAFHFGAAEPQPLNPDQPTTKKETVIYDISSGKPAAQVDVTDPRDNPFLPQTRNSADRASQAAH